jgi:hypothetical protein
MVDTKKSFLRICRWSGGGTGYCSIRHQIQHTYVPEEIVPVVSQLILKAIIGATDLTMASIADVILMRHPNYDLPESKVRSLKEKYFAIPAEFYSYYPVAKEGKKNVVEDSTRFAVQRAQAAVGKKLGRPRLAVNAEMTKVQYKGECCIKNYEFHSKFTHCIK